MIVALFFAPRFAARVGKRHAAIIIGLLYTAAAPALYFSRVLGVLPANASTLLCWMLSASSFVSTALAMAAGILGSSMLAEVVEHNAARTGRHAAGLLFSANAFVPKAISSIGCSARG